MYLSKGNAVSYMVTDNKKRPPVGILPSFDLFLRLRTFRRSSVFYLAEEVGFEPTIPLQVWQFSRLLPSTTRPPFHNRDYSLLAEREGFEPSRQVTPTYRFSKPAPSASWVPLRMNNAYVCCRLIILDFVPKNKVKIAFSKLKKVIE